MLRCGIYTSPPFRTPYSRLIGDILTRVVPFLAHLYSMQVLWEGHYRWYRIGSKIRTGVFDNGRGKVKDAYLTALEIIMLRRV